MSQPTSPSGEERDLDAEFAALMGDLDLPADLRQDLAGTSAPGNRLELAAEGPQPRETPLTGRVDPDSVPHNTYKPPQEDELTEEQRAQVAALSAALDAGVPEAKAVKVAVVLTPLTNAEALAALVSMSDLDCVVVPARSGAFAVKEFVSAHAEWDIEELLGGTDTEPAEAAELAATLSRLSRAGAVLLTADLASDVGVESGLSGTITARGYVGGQAGQEASAGLTLSGVDQVVEDVLLGVTRAEDVPGAMRSSEVRVPRTMRWLSRGLRRPSQD